jgi:hypothetical protein
MGPEGTIPEIEKAVREICATPVEDDGLRFDPTSLKGEAIREDQEHRGVRTRLVATMGNAKIPVQVDVGFGDLVTPSPRLETYPTALKQPQPRVLVYSREAVVGEKLEAMVALGPRNSRMKDFYDLHFLAAKFHFSGRTLAQTVRATFEHRKTQIPDGIPFGLTEEFAAMPERAAQWRALIRRGRLQAEASLSSLLRLLRSFLVPVVDAVRVSDAFRRNWPPGGPWS